MKRPRTTPSKSDRSSSQTSCTYPPAHSGLRLATRAALGAGTDRIVDASAVGTADAVTLG